MKIEHVAFNVPAPAAMADWWVEHLDMRIVAQGGPPVTGRFLADATGRTLVEIYANPAAPTPDYTGLDPLVLHLAFVSADIAADRARLGQAGATPLGEIQTTPAGDRVCMLRDPWGFPLQLVQRAQAMP